MADYKVEVDLSELFDDMTINEQKNFLVDKFCSLPIDKMVEVVKALNEEASIYMNYEIPEVKLGGNPPSGKESRRTRRMLELRKRKGRL